MFYEKKYFLKPQNALANDKMCAIISEKYPQNVEN